MKNSVLVTITGLAHYYGTKPFKVGAVIKLKKEYDNKYDDEAIRAQLPYIGTVTSMVFSEVPGSFRISVVRHEAYTGCEACVMNSLNSGMFVVLNSCAHFL